LTVHTLPESTLARRNAGKRRQRKRRADEVIVEVHDAREYRARQKSMLGHWLSNARERTGFVGFAMPPQALGPLYGRSAVLGRIALDKPGDCK
jgi:hypothetical protein